MSTGAIKGANWRPLLYFIKHDNTGSPYATEKIEDASLLEYFDVLGTRGEKIVKVEIFKNHLRSLPMLFGAWHEFLVVESTNWWWSFEKQSDGLYVQRSIDKASVKNRLNGKSRTGTVKPEGRDAKYGKGDDSIYSIFKWIYAQDEINDGYHLTESNCHYFASLLFEAIARQKGRRL